VSTVHLIDIGSEPAGADARNTVGGWPVLDAGLPRPACDCGERMVLLFQVDVPTDVPVLGDDHLLVFQCPKHNDANCPPSDDQLPARFSGHAAGRPAAVLADPAAPGGASRRRSPTPTSSRGR
jgi:hypothetical protein